MSWPRHLIAAVAALLLIVIVIATARRGRLKSQDPEAGDGGSGAFTTEQNDVETLRQLEELLLPGEIVPGNIHPAANLLDTSSQYYKYLEDGGTVTAAVGIDVSGYQGTIDYEKVREAGIRFVFIRIGYQGYESGKLVVDDRFYRNYDGARAAGLPVGVYFFSQALTEEEARQQAGFLLATLEGRQLQLPVVYDYEVHDAQTARASGLTRQQASANAEAFCERIRESGLAPMVYMNDQTAYGKYDLNVIGEEPIWYASYVTAPSLSSGFTCWQYSSSGKVPGIDYDVDLNLLFLQRLK